MRILNKNRKGCRTQVLLNMNILPPEIVKVLPLCDSLTAMEAPSATIPTALRGSRDRLEDIRPPSADPLKRPMLHTDARRHVTATRRQLARY